METIAHHDGFRPQTIEWQKCWTDGSVSETEARDRLGAALDRRNPSASSDHGSELPNGRVSSSSSLGQMPWARNENVRNGGNRTDTMSSGISIQSSVSSLGQVPWARQGLESSSRSVTLDSLPTVEELQAARRNLPEFHGQQLPHADSQNNTGRTDTMESGISINTVSTLGELPWLRYQGESRVNTLESMPELTDALDPDGDID